jgi:hypothetical protein
MVTKIPHLWKLAQVHETRSYAKISLILTAQSLASLDYHHHVRVIIVIIYLIFDD